MREKLLEMLKITDEYISGEELSKKFGLSRTAIWKHINKLRNEGYEILSITNKGYKINSLPIKLSPSEIKNLLHTKYLGTEIKFLESIDSTNTYLKKEAIDNSSEGYMVISREQTLGKGRLGRTWESQSEKGLYFSVLLRPKSEINNIRLITLGASLAVCDTLNETLDMDAYIKWPNDILIGGKKVCGILTEAELAGELGQFNYIIVGIGVNVFHTANDFSSEISKKATSLFLNKKANTKININSICASIINNLDNRYSQILEHKDYLIIDNYKKKLGIVNSKIIYTQNNKELSGIVKGINEDGELLIESDGLIKSIGSGEITLENLYEGDGNDN